MQLSKITSRGQTTIPKRIREAVNFNEGDVIAFEVKDRHVLIYKVAPARDEYLQSLSSAMNEWTSPEDEEAWRDL